jgi:hypothetical protein
MGCKENYFYLEIPNNICTFPFNGIYDLSIGSRANSVGIATGYGLDDKGEREFE